MNTERIVISGFGGQGALTIGQIIASLYMNRGWNVTWIPSYGAEMRGGTANCAVIASEGIIGSPLITRNADVVMALNNPSVDKFLPAVSKDGAFIVNSSIVSKEIDRDDIRVIKVDATNISSKLNNPKTQNMVMLGAYLKLHPDFTDAEIEKVLKDKFGKKAENLLPLNMEAIGKGKADSL